MLQTGEMLKLWTYELTVYAKAYVRDYDPQIAAEFAGKYGENFAYIDDDGIQWSAEIWRRLKADPPKMQKFIDIVIRHGLVPDEFCTDKVQWDKSTPLIGFLKGILTPENYEEDSYEWNFDDLTECIALQPRSADLAFIGNDGMKHHILSPVEGQRDSALTRFDIAQFKSNEMFRKSKVHEEFFNRLHPVPIPCQEDYEIRSRIQFGLKLCDESTEKSFIEKSFMDDILPVLQDVSLHAKDDIIHGLVRQAVLDGCVLRDSISLARRMAEPDLLVAMLPVLNVDDAKENGFSLFARFLPRIAGCSFEVRRAFLKFVESGAYLHSHDIVEISSETALMRNGVVIPPVEIVPGQDGEEIED